MTCEWYHYLVSMILLVFSIGSIIAGLFTAYFGSQKARYMGAFLILLGLLVGLVFAWCAWLLPGIPAPPLELCGCITSSIVAVLGALVGALIALGLFIVAILKA